MYLMASLCHLLINEVGKFIGFVHFSLLCTPPIFELSATRLEIDFSSRGAILLPGVSICIVLFRIE
jgi:hypothetical protein